MYNDISEILIKAARSASQATVLELIKQANSRKPRMVKEAKGWWTKPLADLTMRGLAKTVGITTGALAAGKYGIDALADYNRNLGIQEERDRATQERKTKSERAKAIDTARSEGHKAGRDELASELETQRRAAAEREAIITAARQAGIANASEMTIDQLANFFAQHPEVQVPDSLRDLVNSRNQSDLSTMLSNNKFMLGGGLAGAGIGYGLAGEDTKSKVLGALLGGSLGGGLGALVDNYVK